MRRAGRGVHTTAGDSDYSGRRVAPSIEERGETGEELTNVNGSFMLVTQSVNSLEACVVVHDDKCITASAVD
eukprot:6213432-Pleurochrysis_carterae.AAC.2